MESSARATKSTSGKSRWLWWLLSGLALGILGTIFVPDLARPYLPAMMRGEAVEISGIVEAKSREADRLLLTISGSSGAVLVTYTHQVAEMDLLIEPGDSVILAVREYEPFVEDPSVRRVQKGSSIQQRARPEAAGQEAGQSEIQRRQVPAIGQSEQQPVGDSVGQESALDAGPGDSAVSAVEGEATSAVDQATTDPSSSDQGGDPE